MVDVLHRLCSVSTGNDCVIIVIGAMFGLIGFDSYTLNTDSYSKFTLVRFKLTHTINLKISVIDGAHVLSRVRVGAGWVE